MTDAKLFFLTGVKSSRRIIYVDKISDYIYEDLNSCEISKDIVLKSLIGFHSFTGYDTISAFAGPGKVKPIKLMLKDEKYIKMFSRLGENTNISTEILDSLIEFVCHMYGWKVYDSVDEICYSMYCQITCRCQHLPPCAEVLELHVMKANYQARIWRESSAVSK